MSLDASAAAARDRVQRYAADRDMWRRTVASTLAADERLDSLIEIGSLGRGDGDMFSDVDLIAVPAPDAHATLVGDPAGLLPPAGPVLFHRSVRRNAPAGGAYVGVCFNLHGLPLWTDLYLWPAATVAIPSDAAVMFHRPRRRLPACTMGLVDLLNHTGTEAGDGAGNESASILLRVIVAAKYLARRDRQRLTHHLRALNLDAVDPAATAVALTTAARTAGQTYGPDTVEVIAQWIALTARLGAHNAM